jgi:hypothetical protein
MEAGPSGPSPRPRPRAAALSRAVGLALAALVLWRLAAAGRELPHELAAFSPRSLARSLARPLEKRIQDAIPRPVRDYTALADLTPPEACIQVPRAPDVEGATWSVLRSLYFPRRFRAFDPALGWDAEPGTYLLAPAAAGLEPRNGRATRVGTRGPFELWLAPTATESK